MGTKTHATVTIDRTSFGDITIDGQTYDHDVLIRLDGSIEKRKKKLSKKQYGTSHVVSLAKPSMFMKTAQGCWWSAPARPAVSNSLPKRPSSSPTAG